ncbi:MAG: DUF1998 domain-containing protein [Deltaproteobacteria bacterium]
MPRNELGSLRRSQAVGVHGPGAIIDFRGSRGGASVSVVAGGLEAWDERTSKPGLGNDQVIYEPRLQQKLDVDGFRLPPVAPEVAPGVPSKRADKLIGARFPQYQLCPGCHRLRLASAWGNDPGEPALYCEPCSDDLPGAKSRQYVLPVRFVRVCDNGHLDEFPWDFWVRHDPACKRKKGLTLRATDTAGLAGLVLSCRECKMSKSMEGCFDQGAYKPLGGCRGKRPWLGDAEAGCTAIPRVVQRGASNLYFAAVQSALDIPPWSDPIQKKLAKYWRELVEAEDADLPLMVKLLKLDVRTGRTREAIVEHVRERKKLLSGTTEESLRWEEYCQFIKHDKPFGEASEFEIRPEQVPPELGDWISRLVVATRLREVRAVTGFTRVHPPGDGDDPRIASLSVHPKRWLPAVEVRGEGIFLELGREKLVAWEQLPQVAARAANVNERYRNAQLERGTSEEYIRTITPRLLLIHSLSHAIIRQLALSSGYSGASIRERLYVGTGDWDMGGFLVYTASPDADGTLGGLARKGRSTEMADTFWRALEGLRWCSSDPLCIEGRSSLSHQLNGAACHACILAAETTCEEFNYLLDRSLLVGTSGDPALGYFSDYVQLMDNDGL